MKRILLLDDEVNVLQSLQRGLRKMGQEQQFVLELHSSAAEAIKRLGEAQFHIVISDYHMPDMSGVEFLKITKVMQPYAIRMMLSASAEFKTVLGAVNEAQVFRYIEKPWDLTVLEETIQLGLAEYDQIQSELELIDNVQAQHKELTPQELEQRRLEKEEPGITKVNWGPDGSVMLDK
jgi:two-component system, probable response regulator PhcQ